MEKQSTFAAVLRASATLLASVAAITVAIAVVHREFFSDVAVGQQPTSRPVDDWTRITSSEYRTGPADARVVVVEFVDYQCPACKRYDALLRGLLNQFPGEVAVVYRDLPLEEIHPFAYSAARAVRCAAQQGRFDALHDTLFAQQRSLGHKAIVAMASEAGVVDTVALAACANAAGRHEGIDADIALARELSLTGTPSIAINGLLYRSPPDSLSLFEIVKSEITAPGRSRRTE